MDKNYKKTRVKLTLLYFLIIFAIVLFFSIVIIQNQYDQLSRIDRYRQHIIVPLSSGYINSYPSSLDFSEIISKAKDNLLIRVIETDVFILLTAILLSYYLSGKTLEPIETALENQKKFIANASHELRTPLTAITTEAEVLLKSERSTERYKDFTKSVLEEAKRLNKLTTQLLSIAKSDSHHQKLILEEIDLINLTESEIDKFKSLANQKSIEIKTNYSQSPFLFRCDKQRIIQLMDILIDNAIKYNKENGEININLVKNTSGVKITFSDTGIGISKDNIERVFDRFYRATVDRHAKGFGLGLSIAKEIVNELNGEINIESVIDKGTRVVIIFNQKS